MRKKTAVRQRASFSYVNFVFIFKHHTSLAQDFSMLTWNQVKAQINAAINKIEIVETQGGKAQQLIWANIPNVGKIQCRCVSDLKAGQAIALLTDKGNWWVAGELANNQKTDTRYLQYRQTQLTKVVKEEVSVFFVLLEPLSQVDVPSIYQVPFIRIGTISKNYRVAITWVNMFGTGYIGFYDENNTLQEISVNLPQGEVSAVNPKTDVLVVNLVARHFIGFRFEGTILEFGGGAGMVQLETQKREIILVNHLGYQRLSLSDLEYPGYFEGLIYCFREKLFHLIFNRTGKYFVNENGWYLFNGTERTIELLPSEKDLLYKINPKTLEEVEKVEIDGNIFTENFCGVSLLNPCHRVDRFEVAFSRDSLRFRGKEEKAVITNLEQVRTELRAGNTAKIEYTVYSLTNNGVACTATPLQSGIKKVKFSQEIIDAIEQFNLEIYPYLYGK